MVVDLEGRLVRARRLDAVPHVVAGAQHPTDGAAHHRRREPFEEVGPHPVEQHARAATLGEHEQAGDGVHLVGLEPRARQQKALQLGQDVLAVVPR